MADSRKSPQSDYEALELLKQHGIINKDMTWDKIEETSKRIGLNQVGDFKEAWNFIVKNKWIYKDDNPAA
jgi:hypothetical protein